MPKCPVSYASETAVPILGKERMVCKKRFKSRTKKCNLAELSLSNMSSCTHCTLILGLIKRFVKDLNKTQDCFRYLNEVFQHLLEDKIKRVFIGPDNRR